MIKDLKFMFWLFMFFRRRTKSISDAYTKSVIALVMFIMFSSFGDKASILRASIKLTGYMDGQETSKDSYNIEE